MIAFIRKEKREQIDAVWRRAWAKDPAIVSWFAWERMPFKGQETISADPWIAHALMAGINLRNDLVGRHHQDAIIWPTMISFLRPAIFPEVINLGRIVKKKGKGRPRDLWKGIHLPQTSHFLSSRFLIHSFKNEGIVKEMSCGRLNASWKISSSAVDGQSFLVIDGSLLN